MDTKPRHPLSGFIGSALVTVLAAIVGTTPAWAQERSSTVTLDFQNGTISPADPTINLNSRPSVVLEIVPSGTYRVVPTGFRAPSAKGETRPSIVEGAGASAPEKGQGVSVGERAVFNFDAAKDDAIEHPADSWSWTVHLKNRTRDYPIDVFCDDCATGRRHMVAVIHIETATYDLAWSAGLAVNSLRDERYRLDPIPNDPSNLRLVRNGSSGYPYQLATAANFCLAKPGIEWLCPATVGVSTDIPVDKLTVLLGPAVRFRPLDVRNAFYLGIGVAYGSRKELNDDYAGRSTVPAGTTSASLLTDHRRFGGYVSLTFGFLGSADKFKGVFSGSGEAKGPAPAK